VTPFGDIENAMITEDQFDVIEFLGAPATHGGAGVDRLETHTAVVFLAGPRAYKLKRAVRFDYLDFSTAEQRRAMCEAEVRRNRRTAPGLYLGVVAVTREPDGTLAIDGRGTPVDWLVEMNRFPQEALLDRQAATRHLDLDLMPRLASAIASFHAAAERRPDHGGLAGMTAIVEGNVDGFAEYGASVLDRGACQGWEIGVRAELGRQGALLDERRAAGFVRQCHGDLHLGNIVVLEGRPTLFDAIEFNDRIACVDVHYDLAFLLMDLWHHGLPHHANAVWNGYLAETGDFGGLPLLPLFLSCRAAVRAKTNATTARLRPESRPRHDLKDLARGYLSMARDLLHPAAPRLVAIGGFSGTGKSTVARGIAPSIGAVPGAVVIRSDEIRKRLCGVSPYDRLGPEGYTPEITAQVYATAIERARTVIQAGHSAIVDAVFARAEDRAAVEAVAREASVPFTGLWLDAPERVLVARVERRREDASDATADVIRRQRERPLGPMTWPRVDASLPAAIVIERAGAQVRGPGPAGTPSIAAEAS
jgi:aminoglycoside phosphotransferase family enzyme/predicted kinase